MAPRNRVYRERSDSGRKEHCRASASSGSTKRTVKALPVRDRRISECCRRSLRRSLVIAGLPLIPKKRWPAPPERGGAGLAAFKPAKTAFRPHERRRSRKVRRRGDRDRSIG